MTWLQIIILALIQGLTEFLPISSSAHLILPKELLGWPDQGLAFDVAVHVGSLMAVLIYLRKDWLPLPQATFSAVPKILNKNTLNEHEQLAWGIILATIPIGLCGLAFKTEIEMYLREIWVIASATFLFAILLWWADNKKNQHVQITLQIMLIIGLAQCFALIPGTSRSGVTITAALLCGLARKESARVSFLLSIPVILLAGFLKGFDLFESASNVEILPLLVAMLVSFVSALACVHWMLKWIEKISFKPFVIYRYILALVLLLIILLA